MKKLAVGCGLLAVVVAVRAHAGPTVAGCCACVVAEHDDSPVGGVVLRQPDE